MQDKIFQLRTNPYLSSKEKIQTFLDMYDLKYMCDVSLSFFRIKNLNDKFFDESHVAKLFDRLKDDRKKTLMSFNQMLSMGFIDGSDNCLDCWNGCRINIPITIIEGRHRVNVISKYNEENEQSPIAYELTFVVTSPLEPLHISILVSLAEEPNPACRRFLTKIEIMSRAREILKYPSILGLKPFPTNAHTQYEDEYQCKDAVSEFFHVPPASVFFKIWKVSRISDEHAEEIFELFQRFPEAFNAHDYDILFNRYPLNPTEVMTLLRSMKTIHYTITEFRRKLKSINSNLCFYLKDFNIYDEGKDLDEHISFITGENSSCSYHLEELFQVKYKMAALNFNNLYLKGIMSNFYTVEQICFISDKLFPEQAEFEEATAKYDEISDDEHNAFTDAVQKLVKTLISCSVGVFKNRQNGNKIATIALMKMLSHLFLVGHRACEDRLKCTKYGTKDIEDKIELYKVISNAILCDEEEGQKQEQQLHEDPMNLERGAEELIEQMQPLIDVKQDTLENIQDDVTPFVPPPEKKSKVTSAIALRSHGCNNFDGVIDGCQKCEDGDALTSLLSRISHTPTVNEILPQTCLTYQTGVTVGYSDTGKLPILIVSDAKLKDSVYLYRCMLKGRFRCTGCGVLKAHRYAKLYQGVLYANLHACEGKPRKTVEQDQRQRAERFKYAPLPSLLELSTSQDPRPYPPYPNKQPDRRSRNPSSWEDLIEYTTFATCLARRSGKFGYVAYDYYNPNTCYEYAAISPGSYQCVFCKRFGKNTIAKVDESRSVLQSSSHVCHGISIDQFKASQAERRPFKLVIQGQHY